MKVLKLKTVFICFSAVLLGFILFAVGINLGMRAFSGRYIAKPDDARIKDSDCILILGALVWKNGQPSHVLEDRILTGTDLYHSGISDAILMSGDHGRNSYDEVNAMKKYAVGQGVPKERIFTDHAGFSTYDSCYRAGSIFRAKKVVIVTQRYHLYRALYIARGLGLDAYGVACDRRSLYGKRRKYVREFFAGIKAFCAVMLKVRPKYMGEEIPIQTSTGSMTDG